MNRVDDFSTEISVMVATFVEDLSAALTKDALASFGFDPRANHVVDIGAVWAWPSSTPNSIKVKVGKKTKYIKLYSDGSPVETEDKPRKRRAPCICVIPRCKGVGAPRWGMACEKHKDMSKHVIKSFRLARKAAKAKGK